MSRFWAGLTLLAALSCNWAYAQEPPEKPGVRITFPIQGAVLRGTQTIRITPRPAAETALVTLSVDEALLDSDETAPYEIAWETRRLPDGPHKLIARAQTKSGRWSASEAISITVDNQPPQVELKPPAAQTLTGPTLLEATATDNVGVETVRFFAGPLMVGEAKTPPYSVTWDPSANPNGLQEVKVEVTDLAGNQTQSKPVQIRISNLNKAPILLPIEPKRVLEGKTLTFSVTAFDPDGKRDPLTFKATGQPPWAVLNAQTGQWTVNPDPSVSTLANPLTAHKILIEVCDPEPLCASQEFSITAVNANQPPELEPLQNLTIEEGEQVSFHCAASDLDRDPLKFEWVRLPPWLSFDPESSTLKGTPGFEVASSEDPERTYSDIQARVSDPEPMTAQRSFSIVVKNKDRAPRFEPVAKQSIDEGKFLSFEIQASDPDGDDMELSIVAAPMGAALSDHGGGSGTLRWNSRLDQGGQYELVFRAKGKEKGSASTTLTVPVQVREVSQAISGVVRDQSEKPFQGATLEVSQANKVIRSAMTNAQGFYMIDGLPNGEYIVTISYITSWEFNANERTNEGVHFTPLSQKVKLQGADKTGVNFTALPL